MHETSPCAETVSPDPRREWVLATAVAMVDGIAERHCREYGADARTVEKTQADYLMRLTESFVANIVAEHGDSRNPARLYRHLAEYFSQMKGQSLRNVCSDASRTSLDAGHERSERQAGESGRKRLEPAAPSGDVFEQLLTRETELADLAAAAAVERGRAAAALLLEHDLAQARRVLDRLFAHDDSPRARTVLRKAAGMSSADIAREDGVAENTINQRLSRWWRQSLTARERASLAPLRIVVANPAKGRRA
jgi:DNA-directed RNA polymerase specialized sigma24 family protein